MRKKIDIFFKNKLDEPQGPPLDAWSNIQDRLPKEKKRPFGFYMGLLTAGLIVSGLIGTGLYLSDKDSGVNTGSTPITHESVINSGTSNETGIQNQNNRNNNSNSEIENTIEDAIVNGTDNQSIFSVTSNNTDANQTYYSSDSHYNNSAVNHNSTGIAYGSGTHQNLFAESLASHHFAMNKYGLEGVQSNGISHFEPIKSGNLLAYNQPFNKELKKQAPSAVKKNNNKSKSIQPKFDIDRFSFSAFVSPTALNTFVGSSMLSDKMGQYDTENKITLAYGMKAAYEISPKVKLRAGVSMVGFEQITKNVPLVSDLDNHAGVQILDPTNNITYNGNIRINNHVSENDGEISNKTSYGNIKQQTQYLEIPLEMEVAVFQTENIGISATGGGSTWIVAKNKLFVDTLNHTEDLGEATNLNSASFSANAGMKFDLKVSDAINFNVEPHFKYLINPVNNIEKYNPYSVGVNAGVTIKLK